ncbi:MAG: hypothetical protein WBX22_02075 [Silvibacterium sp.]
MSFRAGLFKALRASLFGWIAGMLAATPFQIVEAIRTPVPNDRLLILDLSFALALWIALTFALALYFCGLFLLPMAWMVPVAWILRHRGLWMAASTVFGIALMAMRAHVWTALYHDGVSLINFWMWAIFSATFFLVTSAFYSKYLRDEPAAASGELGVVG